MLYREQEIDIALTNFIEGVAIIPLPTGETICIPEEGATAEELELIQTIKADVEARVPIITDPILVSEPVDEEKAAMAEAIIDMSNEIEMLKIQIAALEGGGA